MLKMDITAADRFYTNADKVFRCAIYQADGVTPEDVGTGWSFRWFLKRRDTDGDVDALIEKQPADITVTGVYDVDPAQNTQRVVFTVTDEDLADVPAGFYVHELKRDDAGAETPLIKGRCVLLQSGHQG
jgi:hypothetical protein